MGDKKINESWRFRRGITAAIAIAAALMMQAPSSVGAADLVTVKVANPTALLHLPYYVAIEQGFFKKQGLEIENITTFNWVPAVLSGDVDFATASPDALVIGASKGKPVPSIVTEQQTNSITLLASTTLKLPNLAKGYPEYLRDLKGASIGVPNLGTGNESFIRQSFTQIGFENGRDYSMVAMGANANILNALRAHKTEAATLIPPFTELAISEKSGVALTSEPKGEGPETNAKGVGTNIVVNPAYAKAHPDVVKKFIAAIVEADAYVRDTDKNMERLAEIVAKYQAGVSIKAIDEQGIRTIASLAYPGVSCKSWQLVAQGLMTIGAVPAIPKCEDMIALDVAPKGPLGPGK